MVIKSRLYLKKPFILGKVQLKVQQIVQVHILFPTTAHLTWIHVDILKKRQKSFNKKFD